MERMIINSDTLRGTYIAIRFFFLRTISDVSNHRIIAFR